MPELCKVTFEVGRESGDKIPEIFLSLRMKIYMLKNTKTLSLWWKIYVKKYKNIVFVVEVHLYSLSLHNHCYFLVCYLVLVLGKKKKTIFFLQFFCICARKGNPINGKQIKEAKAVYGEVRIIWVIFGGKVTA